MFAMGIIGERSYLSDSWNRFDCLVVLVSVVDLLPLPSGGSAFKALRAIRVLRPLRALNKLPALRMQVSSSFVYLLLLSPSLLCLSPSLCLLFPMLILWFSHSDVCCVHLLLLTLLCLLCAQIAGNSCCFTLSGSLALSFTLLFTLLLILKWLVSL